MERRHCLSLPATCTSLCFASWARYSRRHASSTLIPQRAVLSGFHPKTGEARITLITLKKRQLSLLFVQKTPGGGLIFAQTTAPGNRQALNFASLIMLHAVRQTGDGILCLFQGIVDDERGGVFRSMTGVALEGERANVVVTVPATWYGGGSITRARSRLPGAPRITGKLLARLFLELPPARAAHKGLFQVRYQEYADGYKCCDPD